MDFFQTSYYRINKLLLYYLGQWPLQTPGERHFYRSTTILLVGSIVVPKLIKFTECLGNLDGMIRCLPVLGIHARSTARFLNCIINAKQMKKLTNRIKYDWNTNSANLEGTILRRYAERGRLLTIIYADYVRRMMICATPQSVTKNCNQLFPWIPVCTVKREVSSKAEMISACDKTLHLTVHSGTCQKTYMTIALGMYLSLPIIPAILDIVSPLNQSRDRIYLYETEYFVDRDENYVYLMIHACMTMPFSVGMIVAYDTMFAVYVHHACAIFATLGARLENLGGINLADHRSVIDETPPKRGDETYDKIVNCIKIHKEAVEYTSLIEASGYICYFFVVGIDMLAMTLTGFMTVTNLNRPGEALRHGAFAIGEVVHLFYVCWQGHVLMEHSQHIFINAYNINWYDISARAKRLVIVIMMRSAEPCKLTAGKIYVLSMENFATALKTSMSYFTVLLSMQ